MHYLLFYEKVPGFEKLQKPFLHAHRDHVLAAAGNGDLVLAGSFGMPNDGAALLLFEADSLEEVEDFAKRDPYVTGGIVGKWSIRTWDLVVGAERVLCDGAKPPE